MNKKFCETRFIILNENENQKNYCELNPRQDNELNQCYWLTEHQPMREEVGFQEST